MSGILATTKTDRDCLLKLVSCYDLVNINCLLRYWFSGDKHVTEIASMAFDLLAGFVVLQVPHRPSMKLNVRMGFHRKISPHWDNSVTELTCLVAQLWGWWQAPEYPATVSCPRLLSSPGNSWNLERGWRYTSARSPRIFLTQSEASDVMIAEHYSLE